MSSFGVVVVGLGIAGRVRVRDLLQCEEYKSEFPVLEAVELKGYVSSREVEIEGAVPVEFEEALKMPDVHAFIISTENSTHEEYAVKCLRAGKHVLVEFPMTISKSGADYLMDIAKTNNVQCCEEDIALLTDDFKELLEISKEKTLEEGQISLISGVNERLENMLTSGSPFISNISRLQILISLFGSLTPVEASLEVSETEVKGHAKLQTKDQKSLTLDIHKKKGETKRVNAYQFKFTDGTVKENPTPKKPEPAKPPKNPGLFMKDFISFMETVKEGKSRMPSNSLTLESLGLAEKLTEMSKKKTE